MEDGQDTPQSPNGAANDAADNSANNTAHSAADGEVKVGHVLERTRQERGLSLEEVEWATKIRKRYLAGLEEDDYTVLPDAVYARGFLKTYANFLGLDGRRLAEEVRSHRKPRRERGISYRHAPRSDFERPIITPGVMRGAMRGANARRFPVSTVVTIILAIVVVVALIGALYYVGRGALAEEGGEPAGSVGKPPRQENRVVAARDEEPPRDTDPGSEDPVSGVSAADAPASGVTAPGAPVQNAAPLDALAVRVAVEDVPAWIRVRADSRTVYEQVARPGFSETFRAERRVSIRAGDAGAVSAEVNGQSVGSLGTDGQVLTRNFTLKNAS